MRGDILSAPSRLGWLLPLLLGCPRAPLPLPEQDAATMDAPDAPDARAVDVALVDRPVGFDRADIPATDVPRPLSCPTQQRLCGVSCREVSNDPLHCGACGRACVLAAAVAGCEDGGCTLAACRAGFGNCDGDIANGCETATASDVTHCGVCENRCAFANAAVSCVDGRCRRGACQSGFMDCNAITADGCETDVTTDAHCGGCGVACMAPDQCSSVAGMFACTR